MLQSTMSVHAVRSRASLLWAVLLSSLFLLSACGGGGASSKNNISSSSISSTVTVSSTTTTSSATTSSTTISAATTSSSAASNSSNSSSVVSLEPEVVVALAELIDVDGAPILRVTGTVSGTDNADAFLRIRAGDTLIDIPNAATLGGKFQADVNLSSLTLYETWYDLLLGVKSTGALIDLTNSIADMGQTIAVNDRAYGFKEWNGDLKINVIDTSIAVAVSTVELLDEAGVPTLRVIGTVIGTNNSDTFLRIRTGNTVINVANSSITEGQFSADVSLAQLTQASIWYDVLMGITSKNSLTDLSDSLADMGQAITVDNRIYSFKEWGGQLKISFDDTSASSSSSEASTSSSETSSTAAIVSSVSSTASSVAPKVMATSVGLLVDNGIPMLRVTGTITGTDNSSTLLRIRTGSTIHDATNSASIAGQFSVDFDLRTLTLYEVWYDLLVGVTAPTTLTDLTPTMANTAQSVTVDGRLYEFKTHSGNLKINIKDVSVAASATAVTLIDRAGVPTLRVTGTITGTSNDDVYLSIRTNGETYNILNTETTVGLFSADFDPAVLTKAGTWYDIVLGITSKNTLTSISDLHADMTQTLSKDGRTYEFKQWDHLLKINVSVVMPGENQSIRLDFGLNDTTNGNQTTSPDTNGAHWNNVLTNVAAGAAITAPITVSGLKTTNNIVTAAKVTINTSATTANRWLANGRNTGGLLTPSPTYLNEYAISTATEDFFFVQSNGTATLTLSGLDPNRLYNLKFFGTRAASDLRRTTYTVTGATPEQSAELQTSGTGVGAGGHNGNNNTLASITGAHPTTTGELTITVRGSTGQFGYLGFLEITGGASKAAVPAEVARWVAQDTVAPLAANSVLFVGSSSVRRWETLTEDFRDYNIIQRGWGGSWFTGVNNYAPWVVWPYQPSAIVMWAGTNDLNGNQTAQHVLNEYRTFVGNMKTQSPHTHFFWISITPNTGNAHLNTVRMETNMLIKQETSNDSSGKLHYIDVATHFEHVRDTAPQLFTDYYVDSLHLSRTGYAYWANAVRTALASVVPANKVATANSATLVTGEKLFFDFGPSNTSEGDLTSIDSNGNHWNNWVATNGGGLVNVGEHIANLVDSTGRNTGIGMTIAAGFLVNGKTTGGLLAPDAALLGDLAVATATQDFFFSSADGKWNGSDDDLPGGLMLTGLNPAQTYAFHLFGSRVATDTRITEYSVRGHNAGAAQLQTSGTGISHDGTKNGNDSQIAVITGIQPDAFGQVWIDLTVIQGSYAYLNAIKVVAE